VIDTIPDEKKEFVLACRRAQAEKARWFRSGILEGMRRISGDVERLASSPNRPRSPESEFDFPFKDREHLLEIVPMKRRPSARRNVHVNQTVTASSVAAAYQNRVSITGKRDVGESVFCIRPDYGEFSMEIIGRNRRSLLRGGV